MAFFLSSAAVTSAALIFDAPPDLAASLDVIMDAVEESRVADAERMFAEAIRWPVLVIVEGAAAFAGGLADALDLRRVIAMAPAAPRGATGGIATMSALARRGASDWHFRVEHADGWLLRGFGEPGVVRAGQSVSIEITL